MVYSDGYHDSSTDLAIHCVVFPSLPSQIVNPLFLPVLHSQVVSNIDILFSHTAAKNNLRKISNTLRMCISFGGFLREILAIGGRGDDEVAAGGGFWW